MTHCCMVSLKAVIPRKETCHQKAQNIERQQLQKLEEEQDRRDKGGDQ